MSEQNPDKLKEFLKRHEPPAIERPPYEWTRIVARIREQSEQRRRLWLWLGAPAVAVLATLLLFLSQNFQGPGGSPWDDPVLAYMMETYEVVESDEEPEPLGTEYLDLALLQEN